MIRQRKPLQRRTPIAQKTPLKSSGPVKPRKRPTVTPEERDARKLVQRRSLVGDVRMCEMAIPGVCLGRATNYAHRVNASQGGKWEASTALDSCGSGTTGCHGYCHANPANAYENGWLVRSWDDPLTRPVLRRGQWVVLDNAGSWTPSLDLGAA